LIFGGDHQRSADSSAPGAGMHEQLGKVSAKGLVLLWSQDQLHRSIEAALHGGSQNQPLTSCMAQKREIPPDLGLCSRHWPHEIDGGTVFHRVDQEVNQSGTSGLGLLWGQEIDREFGHAIDFEMRMTA
jgi:hypothetical protein